MLTRLRRLLGRRPRRGPITPRVLLGPRARALLDLAGAGGELAGRELGARAGHDGLAGPTFHGMMAGLARRGLVVARDVPIGIEGQLVFERRYALTAAGRDLVDSLRHVVDAACRRLATKEDGDAQAGEAGWVR